jgi:UDP-N-acetylmuramoyl-L-alanyl-D-glutamate--2,6-diaminopimelate ligase
MGAAAAAGADVVIVTDDNPRNELPAAIRAQVMAGAQAVANTRAAELIDGGDRRAAIRQALELATPGDAIAVLGKGHETGQEIGGRVLPFDDASVIAQEWTRRLLEGSR